MTGKVVNVANAYKDPRFNPAIDGETGYRTRTLLAAPVRNLIDGEVVGAFEVLNKKHGEFNAEDEEVLRSLAAQAAVAIQTARSIGELTRENANLRRDVEGGTEFMIVTLWDSLAAIKAFAGADIEAAVVPDSVQEMMLAYDRRASHYEVVASYDSGRTAGPDVR